ncbi:MAG TPA: acetate kinase [Terriglobales bacterium]|nr:acetate kinase [Terriglobales bacterium]
MKVLVLNSGSSSQKSALFELGPQLSPDPVAPLWEGKLDWDGNKESLSIKNSAGKTIRTEGQLGSGGRDTSVEKLLQHLWTGSTAILKNATEVNAIGHRIVHGGAKLTEPTRVTPEVRQAIADVASIAPLHNQAGLQGIDLTARLFPEIPQLVVFDTGFHRTLPDEAKIYAGPYSWYEHGIRRYGFHGINHEYCAHRAAEMLHRDLESLKIVTCHLGNGCSLAAIDGGTSIDTTMGFTPLEGLVMGTRGGSLDPGILVHSLRSGTSAADLDSILNHQSGLLGVSGLSSDMRDIVQSMRNGNQRAKLAFDIFIHRLCACIAAMAASLQGLDVLVFTAGIGENSAEVRAAACARLCFLGIDLDEKKNESSRSDTEISARNSRVRILVIRAQEDWSIAQTCYSLLR